MNALHITALNSILWANSMTSPSWALTCKCLSIHYSWNTEQMCIQYGFQLLNLKKKKKKLVSRIILWILACVNSWNSKVILCNYLSSWSANDSCVFIKRHFIGFNRASEIWWDMPSRSSQSHGGVYSLWNYLFRLPGNTRYFDF